MRTKLSEWIDKTFGTVYPRDLFHINEQVAQDKEGNRLRQIVIELKKEQGYKKSWTDDDIRDLWEKQIKEITGDNLLKLEIKSSEGNENKYLGGMANKDGKAKFVEVRGKVYNYRFHLEIIKNEGKNV